MLFKIPAALILLLTMICSCSKEKQGSPDPPSPVASVDSISTSNDSVIFHKPPKDVFAGSALRFTTLCVDNKNNVWIAGNQGIFEYNGSSWKYFNSANSSVPLSSFSVINMVSDKQGTIYIFGFAGVSAGGNASTSLFVYKDSAWKAYPLPYLVNQMKIDVATDLLYFLDRDGAVLYKFNGQGSFSDSANYSFINLRANGDLASTYFVSDFAVNHGTANISINHEAYPFYPQDTDRFGIITYPPSGAGIVTYWPDSNGFYDLEQLTSNTGKDVVMIAKIGWWTPSPIIRPVLYFFDGSSWSSESVPTSIPTTFQLGKLVYAQNGDLWILNYPVTLVRRTQSGYTSFEFAIRSTNYYESIADFDVDGNNVKWILPYDLIDYELGLMEFRGN